MAYMDRPNNDNFYDRKRKNVDEDDHIRDFKRGRQGNDEIVPQEDELETALYLIGELSDKNNKMGGYSIESNIENTSHYILNQIIEKRSEIMNILIECASKVPEKISIYSTLIGLINNQNPNFVEDFIDHLASNLRANLKSGQFYTVHTIIRFISDLANVRVVSSKSIIELYESFVEMGNDVNSPQVRTDFFVYCILSSLPWNGKTLYSKHGPEFDDLLQSVHKYLTKRAKDHMPLLRVWSTDDPHPQEDYLDCLWLQIKKLEENDWIEKQLFKAYASFENSMASAVAHDFPLVVVPEHTDKTIYPMPRVVFRLFDYTDVPEEFILPGAHSIERYLVEEQLHTAINTYYMDRSLCAQKLLQIKLMNKIPLSYMIVEVIFAQLFSLPKSAHLELFYGSLLIELSKVQQKEIKEYERLGRPYTATQITIVLAQACELLYERLDTMKTSCVERFATWFSYHLSNFQYKWSWTEWFADATTTSQDPESPKLKFLRETLTRCMRLSYHQRLMDFLPESLHTQASLIPAQPKPTYKYISEEAADLEGTAVANRLLELLKERAIPEELFQALREIPDKYNEADNEYETFNPLKIEVFTSTLLYYGHKSFSHTFASLAKYHMIFKMIVENEDSQLVVLNALHQIWKNHQQMIVVLVDKMLKTQIVECSSVVKWIFSDEMKSEVTSFYVWEILHSTLNRMSKQVDKFRHEFAELSERFKKTSAMSAMDDEMNVNEITEEELEQKQATLNALADQQQQLFFLVVQRFVEILNEKLSRPDVKIEDGEKQDPSSNEFWLKWMSERFEDTLLVHSEEILLHLDELKAQFVDSHKLVQKIYKAFSALKK